MDELELGVEDDGARVVDVVVLLVAEVELIVRLAVDEVDEVDVADEVDEADVLVDEAVATTVVW